MEIILDEILQLGEHRQIGCLSFELTVTHLLSHLETFTFEMVFDIRLNRLMMLSNVFHKALEYLMCCTALLLWIHHVQKISVLPKLATKCPPLSFVIYLPCQQTLTKHISKLHSIRSLS